MGGGSFFSQPLSHLLFCPFGAILGCKKKTRQDLCRIKWEPDPDEPPADYMNGHIPDPTMMKIFELWSEDPVKNSAKVSRVVYVHPSCSIRASTVDVRPAEGETPRDGINSREPTEGETPRDGMNSRPYWGTLPDDKTNLYSKLQKKNAVLQFENKQRGRNGCHSCWKCR